MALSVKTVFYFFCKFVFMYLIFMDNAPTTRSFDYDYVTVGSAFKLLNKAHSVRLHSHEVKYGSGSGQQSVTGMRKKEDGNSYWQVKSPTDEVLKRGEPIKCGQKVRLTHVNTMSNLHSHHFRAPLSSSALEVSCFGTDGEGDHLDDWIVECSGSVWLRDQYVAFRHVETDLYLTCSDQTFGRPIPGQHEIVASNGLDNKGRWKTMEGVFIKPVDGGSA